MAAAALPSPAPPGRSAESAGDVGSTAAAAPAAAPRPPRPLSSARMMSSVAKPTTAPPPPPLLLGGGASRPRATGAECSDAVKAAAVAVEEDGDTGTAFALPGRRLLLRRGTSG